MNTEPKPLSQRIYDGARAREVLENEAFQQVFADMKAEIKDTWEQSPSRDCEGREKLWLMLSLANKLEAMLKTTLDTGKLAELDLEHERKKQTILQRARESVGL